MVREERRTWQAAREKGNSIKKTLVISPVCVNRGDVASFSVRLSLSLILLTKLRLGTRPAC